MVIKKKRTLSFTSFLSFPTIYSMKVFTAFVILICSTILWFMPVTEGVYDFRTDVRNDNFYAPTVPGVTSVNSTLHAALYDTDTSTISLYSNLATDVPAYVSYNATSRVLNTSGYTANTTRTLTVTYDVDALSTTDAIDLFLDIVPWIYYLMVAAFPVAGVAAIFTGRA